MPSFCVVESCKRFKQPGDAVSFHKFPLYNAEINQKWIDFVNKSSRGKFVPTKYSSICSSHFKESDFNPSGAMTRKFIKKTAFPSIFAQRKEIIDKVVIEDEPLIYESCGLCRSQTAMHRLHPFDEINFTLIRKCFPFVNFNINPIHKMCIDCETNLNNFSSFIDKILGAQNLVNQEIIMEVTKPMGIKTEPPQEDELINLLQVQKPATQKKLEILEIVDIKPLNFLPYETNALSCEVSEGFEEGECQILSPRQFKVEIAEDGENELEMVRKYMHISTVFQHDHCYAQEGTYDYVRNVKTEYVEEILESPEVSDAHHDNFYKICCRRKFKSCRHYLLHKVFKHKMKSCRKCAKNFTSEISLMHHKKYFCPKIQRKKKVKTKTEPVKKPGKFVCPICSKRFKGSKNLYQHKLSHRESNYSCNICSKLFKRKHGLRQHIKAQHENKKSFQCPICYHQFALKGDVKRCKHSDLKKKKKV